MKKEYDFSKAKRGAVVAPAGKTRITIYLDDEIVQEFKKKEDRKGLTDLDQRSFEGVAWQEGEAPNRGCGAKNRTRRACGEQLMPCTRAARAMLNCRTAALGGHVERCLEKRP